MNAIAGASFLILCAALVRVALREEPSTAPVFARAYTQSLAAEDIALIASTTDATSTTPLGDAILEQFVSRYATLAARGTDVNTIARSATDIVPRVPVSSHDPALIPTDADTSLARVLTYRSELRDALAPLLNNTDPELDIYAQWIDTGDKKHLERLDAIADDYEKAVTQARILRVPADAVHLQAGILDAMSEFSLALRALARNAEDPIASLTLLRTFNAAEEKMFTAFNALGIYAASKTQL